MDQLIKVDSYSWAQEYEMKKKWKQELQRCEQAEVVQAITEFRNCMQIQRGSVEKW